MVGLAMNMIEASNHSPVEIWLRELTSMAILFMTSTKSFGIDLYSVFERQWIYTLGNHDILK